MSNEEKILQMLGQVMESQSRMEGDIAGLKEDVSGLKTDVAELKEGQKRLEENLDRTFGKRLVSFPRLWMLLAKKWMI